MEVHPSYNFSDQDWHNIPHEERNRLIQERQAYNANKRQRISEVKTEDRGSHQQQPYAGGAHIMGGRNEQEALRNASRRGDGNAWNAATATSFSSVRTGRRISSTSTSQVSEPEAGTVGKNESDSNADTCCLGANFIILRYTQRTADVYPYESSYTPMTNMPIVNESGSRSSIVVHPLGFIWVPR